MLDKIKALREEIASVTASDKDAVEQLRIKYLSKKGAVSALMADFRNVPAELKREVGQKINELKTFATEKINSLKESFAVSEDSSLDEIDLTLPAVVTADLRLNAPRYVTLPMMMKAKRKPQEVVQASALCPDLRAHVEVVGYEAPAARKVGRKVANVDELIDKLKNEAKVL